MKKWQKFKELAALYSSNYSNIGTEIERENIETTSRNKRGYTQIWARLLYLFPCQRHICRLRFDCQNDKFVALTLKGNGIKNDDVHDRSNNGFL